jgi:hypothetical protein
VSERLVAGLFQYDHRRVTSGGRRVRDLPGLYALELEEDRDLLIERHALVVPLVADWLGDSAVPEVELEQEVRHGLESKT